HIERWMRHLTSIHLHRYRTSDYDDPHRYLSLYFQYPEMRTHPANTSDTVQTAPTPSMPDNYKDTFHRLNLSPHRRQSLRSLPGYRRINSSLSAEWYIRMYSHGELQSYPAYI